MKKLILILIFLLLPVWGWCQNPPVSPEYIKAVKEIYSFLGEDIFLDGQTAHIYLERIDFQKFWQNINRLKPFLIKKIIIDLYSHGGAVFDAIAIGSFLEEQGKNGKIIEIRARGLVASAGLIILVSGSRGYRLIDKNSTIMFHELQGVKFFSIESPTTKEEEAAIYRWIQNKINSFITSRSHISLKELNEKIKNKEFWIDANEAIRLGFADKIL